MRHAGLNRRFDILLPVGIGKGGTAINEIDGEIMEAGFLRQLNGSPCLLSGVRAVHPAEVFLKKRLNSYA